MRHAIGVFALAVILCDVAAFAAEPLAVDPRRPQLIEDVVAGEAHVNGEARWNSVVFWQLSNVCGLTGPDRRIELGKKASAEPRANADDCVATSAWIHNESQQPVYCRVVLLLGNPDDSGRAEITGQKLVMPGAMESVATAYGEFARAPSKAETECKVHDTPLPPPPPCDFKITGAPDPDLFYPEESKRREEQGDVTLDFLVDSAAQKLRDIRVSQSSGHRLLDIAALKVGREMRATASCPERRRRVKVKFRVTETDPVASPGPPPTAAS